MSSISSKAPPGRQARPSRRWPLILGCVLLVLGGLTAAGVLLAPRLAPWVMERRVIPAMERRLHRKITVGRIKGGFRNMVLEDLRVSGPADCAQGPLLHAGRVTVSFDFWPLLSGRLALRGISVDQPRICVRRQENGQDNLSDLWAVLGRRRLPGRVSFKLTGVPLTRGALTIRDEQRGLSLQAPEMEARLEPGGESHLWLGQPRGSYPGLAPLEAMRLDLWFRTSAGRLRGLPRFSVSGARLRLHDHLVLTDISGRLTPESGRWLSLELRGSYGGVGEHLWSATGRLQIESWLRPVPVAGSLALKASRFSMDKLSPLLKTSIIPRPNEANLELDLTLGLQRRVLSFGGQASLTGLTVVHPKLARAPVEDIGLTARVRGRYLFDEDLLQIPEASLERKGVTLRASLDVFRLRKVPRFRIGIEVPTVSCAAVLRALPRGLAPQLENIQLAGRFEMRIAAEADFKYLTTNSVTLEGSVNALGCKVVGVPFELSAERLASPFVHEVEDIGQRFGFEVGTENPDFVPIDQVSMHLQNAILTTEDSRFFHHRGFIPHEFKSAFARNLIAKRFVFGASSITMQMVKNVLLGRQKTLSRKLQEIVLTWYLEQSLPKKRIFEIYLNVIEFGPGIFGVGRAAWHYFGKDASDLEPQEAAFLASILPSPKRHYRKYCHQEVPTGWRRWVDRILEIMHRRNRLNASELQLALASPIKFSDKERGTLSACLARLHRFQGRND